MNCSLREAIILIGLENCKAKEMDIQQKGVLPDDRYKHRKAYLNSKNEILLKVPVFI
jgi:hypothetical protein